MEVPAEAGYGFINILFFLHMIFTLKGGDGARRAPSFPVHKLIEPSFDGRN